MKDLNYMSIAEDAISKIKKGAFLTVKAADALNTMTIGWATFGFIWQKPVMMVAVRSTRHTFGIIEKALDFTVTIPSGDMGKTIAFCGTKSVPPICSSFPSWNTRVLRKRRRTNGTTTPCRATAIPRRGPVILIPS